MTDRGDLRLGAALVATSLLLSATENPTITGFISRNFQIGIAFAQLFAVVVYVMLFIRFLQHKGIISEYDPRQRLAEVVGDYLGPAVSLVVDLTQTLAYMQVSKLLFAGITFGAWDHDLSQIDEWLLTGVAVVVLTVALFNVLSRAQDVRDSWDNVAEVV